VRTFRAEGNVMAKIDAVRAESAASYPGNDRPVWRHVATGIDRAVAALAARRLAGVGMMMIIFATLLANGCDRTSSASPSGAPASAAGLHVVGNKFLNASGEVVRLLGFNQSGAEYACIEGTGIFDSANALTVSTREVEAMASWKGANAVRIPLN
jgi:hypothetical protein